MYFQYQRKSFVLMKMLKILKKSLLKYNEEFVFSGVTTAGTPITIYKGKDSFTILFLTNEGKLCTGPTYTGTIIPKLKLNNGKGT